MWCSARRWARHVPAIAPADWRRACAPQLPQALLACRAHINMTLSRFENISILRTTRASTPKQPAQQRGGGTLQKNENSKKETGGPGFPAGRARLARRRRLGVELSGGSGVDGAAGCSATQCIYGKKSRRDVTAHAAGARREPQRVLRAWVGSCASRHLERLKELTGALVSNCSALEAKFDSPPRFGAHLPKKTVGRTVLKVPGYPRGHTFCSV